MAAVGEVVITVGVPTFTGDLTSSATAWWRRSEKAKRSQQGEQLKQVWHLKEQGSPLRYSCPCIKVVKQQFIAIYYRQEWEGKVRTPWISISRTNPFSLAPSTLKISKRWIKQRHCLAKELANDKDGFYLAWEPETLDKP